MSNPNPLVRQATDGIVNSLSQLTAEAFAAGYMAAIEQGEKLGYSEGRGERMVESFSEWMGEP